MQFIEQYYNQQLKDNFNYLRIVVRCKLHKFYRVADRFEITLSLSAVNVVFGRFVKS